MGQKSRDEEILRILEESPSQFVSVESLAEYFKTSESTIRRDLQRMGQEHRLLRVHGGAASLHFSVIIIVTISRFSRKIYPAGL